MAAQREIFPLETAMRRLVQVAADGSRRDEIGRFLELEVPELRWRGLIATDGHVIIATDRHRGGEPCSLDFGGVWRTFREYWEASIDLDALRAWCGELVWPEPGTCPDCLGDAKLECAVCNGCATCPRCEQPCTCDEGQQRCETCRGTGALARAQIAPRPAILTEAIVIDRVMLARALDAFLPGPIQISGGTPEDLAVCIHQGDVVAFVATMRRVTPDDAPAPILFPRLLEVAA